MVASTRRIAIPPSPPPQKQHILRLEGEPEMGGDTDGGSGSAAAVVSVAAGDGESPFEKVAAAFAVASGDRSMPTARTLLFTRGTRSIGMPAPVSTLTHRSMSSALTHQMCNASVRRFSFMQQPVTSPPVRFRGGGQREGRGGVESSKALCKRREWWMGSWRAYSTLAAAVCVIHGVLIFHMTLKLTLSWHNYTNIHVFLSKYDY